MKYHSTLIALIPFVSAATLATRYNEVQVPLEEAGESLSTQDLRLIELAPGETQWVTEDEKFSLQKKGITFMDITATPDLGLLNTHRHLLPSAVEGDEYDTSKIDPRPVDQKAKNPPPKHVIYPSQPAYNSTVQLLIPFLNKTAMRHNLEFLTGFHTRWYRSAYGKESAYWLWENVHQMVEESGASEKGNATVTQFEHPWTQSSLIVKIPGRTEKTIVIGAHLDSINHNFPALLAAPGADDNGSGTVTIWEALRVLLREEKVVKGEQDNTIEFHWYSAEEEGLLGSQAIFSEYEKQGRDVRAMLNKDGVGYIDKLVRQGKKQESMNVITDRASEPLVGFVAKVIDVYCDISHNFTKCGYACSDHASANKAGYPSVMVSEGSTAPGDKRGSPHTGDDKVEYLSFDHMLQHARMTLGFVYELAFAQFD
ncbi:MAG: Leucine aminopeptidase 1 [Alyxoria varia]|nr:MAG: Leucine aminopeptidase 1 [Alyxoria varia]